MISEIYSYNIITMEIFFFLIEIYAAFMIL